MMWLNYKKIKPKPFRFVLHNRKGDHHLHLRLQNNAEMVPLFWPTVFHRLHILLHYLNHYLNQCWPSSITRYGVATPQWDNQQSITVACEILGSRGRSVWNYSICIASNGHLTSTCLAWPSEMYANILRMGLFHGKVPVTSLPGIG